MGQRTARDRVILDAGFRWDTTTNVFVQGDVRITLLSDALHIDHVSDKWHVELSPNVPLDVLRATLRTAIEHATPRYLVDDRYIDLSDFIGTFPLEDDDFVAIMTLRPGEEHRTAQAVIRREV